MKTNNWTLKETATRKEQYKDPKCKPTEVPKFKNVKEFTKFKMQKGLLK